MPFSAIYARVSTEDQARHGYSLDDQRRGCRERLISLGYTDIKDYIDDGYSGEFLERPALDNLREDLRTNNIDAVMAYDPDRLSRNLTNQLLLADEIEKYDTKLMFVTGDYDCSPEGKLFFSMRGAISEFEKAKIRERSMRGKRAKALSGKLVSNGKPLGYDFDSKNSMYVINEKEANIVQEIFRLYITTRKGFRRLAIDINALGYRNKNGRLFTNSALQRIIGNEMYAGTKWSFRKYYKKIGQRKTKQFLRNQSEWIPISVPPIIDKDTWILAQKVMDENRITAKRKAKYDYLLKNIIKCKECGRSMVGQSYDTYGRRIYHYYACSGKKEKNGCTAKLIRAKKLDDMVWAQLVEFAKGNIDISAFKRKNPNSKKLNQSKTELLSQISQLKKKQAAILNWVKDGTVDIKIADKDLKEISADITAAQLLITQVDKNDSPTIKINNNEILSATTYCGRRNILLNAGIKIEAHKNNNEIIWAFL